MAGLVSCRGEMAVGFLDKNYDKVARWLLCFMVLTLPIQALPMAYPIPRFCRNVGWTFLLLLFVVSLLHFLPQRKSYGKWPLWLKGYLLVLCVWPFICTLVGAVTFPYWDETTNEFLRNTWLVQKISSVYPGILQNETLLHLKYTNSAMMGIFSSLVSVCGIFFSLYVMFHGKGSRYILDTMSRAAVVAALGLCAYSIIEIPWLLTGNAWCADALKWINVHLYDVQTTHGWWPPLLWKGQLRSFTREPSFFGIISTFIIPFLWYRAAMLREKKMWLLLVFFGYMIFLTHARTAQVVFLGELALLVGFSLWGRYRSWGRSLAVVFGSVILAFCFYVSMPILLHAVMQKGQVTSQVVQKPSEKAAQKSTGKPAQKPTTKPAQNPQGKTAQKSTGKAVSQAVQSYVKKDVASVVGLSSRSNAARIGNTVAVFTIGLKNPFFGVGMGFTSPYIADNFPAFAKNNKEVKRWVSMQRKEGFLDSSIPIFNMFGAVMCRYGIPGLLLFLMPLGMEAFYFLRNRRSLLQSGGMVCVLTALGGQVACLLSNTMFYTYPLILAATWFLMRQIVEESVSSKNE